MPGIARVEVLKSGHGHAVYRVDGGGRPLVVKRFAEPDAPEPKNYVLLRELGVPIPRAVARSAQVLTLEDLAAGPRWRLARAEEVEEAAVGTAVAGWYRSLHDAGRALVSRGDAPAHLKREVDALDAVELRGLGDRLGLASAPGWTLGIDAHETLSSALRALPETLTYGVLHWTNLALSRGKPLRALVFDYDLLGIGPAESDVRNVLASLGPRAGAAFREAYGPLDERALALDAPLALLYGLREAAARPMMPRWGADLLRAVREGQLERALRAALAAV